MDDKILEEYKRLKEKNTKKPLRFTSQKGFCPSCSRALCRKGGKSYKIPTFLYCPRCGQKLDISSLRKEESYND